MAVNYDSIINLKINLSFPILRPLHLFGILLIKNSWLVQIISLKMKTFYGFIFFAASKIMSFNMFLKDIQVVIS